VAGIIFGRQPVLEVLKSQRSINKVYIVTGLKGSIIDTIFRLAREAKIVVQFIDKKRLDQITDRANHQGVAAQVASVTYADLDQILISLEDKKDALLVLLDRITDPHNLGAIVRSAHQLGADAIIIPKRDACGINETVAKVSAGAIAYMPVIQVNNLVQVIEKCKTSGFWVTGAESNGKKCFEQDLTGKIVLALGSEGYGLQKLILEKCDFVVAIPQTGKLDSLNVSCAASVLLYEIIRQRLQKS
jgi:23S rRNA (guanosine2251-2'-O)-methyltransferase